MNVVKKRAAKTRRPESFVFSFLMFVTKTAPLPPSSLPSLEELKCAGVNETAVISAAHCLPVAVPRLRYYASERNPRRH